MTSQTFSWEASHVAGTEPAASRRRTSRRLWAAHGITGLVGLFLLFDGAMKLVQPAPVVEATRRLGYPQAALFWIGLVLLVCTLLYLLPRTRVLGAVLLTGYLGGAVDAQVRAGSSAFETAFPILFGALVWAGLRLRDDRVRHWL